MMLLRPRLLRSAAGLSALLVLSTQAPAQTTQPTSEPQKEERWFEIEMVVFQQNAASNTTEHWPQQPTLAYPDNWVVLQSPDLEEAPENAANTAGITNVDDDTLSNSNKTTINITRDAFYRLTKDLRQLNSHASALDRKPSYRVLFHEAWRQPVKEKTEAENIIVLGGDQFNQHFELEGSINISVSRYLHIDTNLWFNQFSPNYGQRKEQFVQPPLAPQFVSADASLNISRDKPDNTEKNNIETSSQNNTISSLNTELFTISAASFSAGRSLEDSALGLTSNQWQTQESPLPTQFDQLLDNTYYINQSIVLQQQRRMRSEELHYIDHPVMGVLIHITPYEVPEITLERTNASSTSLQ